jgi:hypothetical protein
MRFIQLCLATIILSFLAAGVLRAAEEPTNRTPDPKLINWMRTNVSTKTGMPFTYGMIPSKEEVLPGIGSSDSVAGIIERVFLNEGLSIYDTAVWQIVLALSPDSDDMAAARKPLEYYWDGSLGELANIRAGYDGSQFTYDPFYPESVRSSPDQKGLRGFIFHLIDANGQYWTADPLDGKTEHEDFPNKPQIHWEDWKPIAGGNAWVVLAALHVLKREKALEYVFSSEQDPVELLLPKELARAALYLQAENGGIRMAPLGTYHDAFDFKSDMDVSAIMKLMDDQTRAYRLNGRPPSAKVRYGEKDYPDYNAWYYETISTENNLSWYAALRMLYRATGDETYRQAMDRIEAYLKSVWDPDDRVFYVGAHFSNGQWKPETEHFAVDVQTWGILALGPQVLDSWFGEGAAYDMWRAAKAKSGVVDPDGRLQGVGFTTEHDRLTVEWTAGAIMAVRLLANYYAGSHPEWSKELKRDGEEMRAGVDKFRFTVWEGYEAYSYSSKRKWIPFGWFSQEPRVLSMTSTGWMVLVDLDMNPFDLK